MSKRKAVVGGSLAPVGTPLAPLLRGSRQRRLCAALGITTVEQFVAADKAAFLAHKDGGERTLAAIGRKIAKVTLTAVAPVAPVAATATNVTAVTATAVFDLLPETLLALPLTHLALPPQLRERLLSLGCERLGAVLQLPPFHFAAGGDPGVQAAADLRACLDHLVRAAIDNLATAVPGSIADWASLKGRLLAPLPDHDRELVCQLIGLGMSPRSLRDIAHARAVPVAELAAAADQARCRMHDRAPSILCRMRFEIARELEACEGAVTGEHLAAGSLAHTMAKAEADPQLPLRLLAFCFPADFHLQEGCLTVMPTRQFRQLMTRLRTLSAAPLLPVSVESLLQQLREVVEPVPRGLVLHLLRHSCGLAITIDPEHGETVAQGTWSLPVRLHEILLEEGKPLLLEDLVFHYRDRHRVASHGRILTQLRADPGFLQIAPRLWSLREWHADEMEEAAALAQAIAATVNQEGARRQVASLLPQHTTERTYYLVLDCLRRDARVRYLGRGEVCATGRLRSAALEQLLKDFRRAGGDVVLSLFLVNQPEDRRRLVGRLLHHNRMFLQPAEDRIDVLTNYPFNDQRLQQLRELVGTFLDGRGGYAAISAVQELVNTTDLGGGWLTPMLLGEVLRRHCGFELLPTGIVARNELALVPRLLQKARAALREARVPLTVHEIVAHQPELAEFRECLQDLLPRDPLLHSRDGLAWQVV